MNLAVYIFLDGFYSRDNLNCENQATRDETHFAPFWFGISSTGMRLEAEAQECWNSIRLWVNHGYSPRELVRINPVRPQNMTVVPGSSVAAKMLKETQQELEKMGIYTDLEATATTIPTISFPEGVGGKANAGERKVYPNDPCPCGSGKKFKKCCGKNR